MLETHFNCIIFFQISALPYPSQHSDRFDTYCRHCHEDRFEFIEQFQKGICSAFISRPIWTIRGCTYSAVFDKRTIFYVCFCSDTFLCTLNQWKLPESNCAVCTTFSTWRWTVSFTVSQMVTDQRDERWRESEWRKLV